MVYDARHIANFILDVGDRSGLALSPMAVQKLVFFSHGWSLAFRDRALVQNRFEAWKFGPVVPVLWDEFKIFGKKPITDRAKFTNPMTGDRAYEPYSLEADDIEFIRIVLTYYAGFSAPALSNLTHEAGTPWKIVREKMSVSANFGGVIDNHLIRKTFSLMDIGWLARSEIKLRVNSLTLGEDFQY